MNDEQIDKSPFYKALFQEDYSKRLEAQITVITRVAPYPQASLLLPCQVTPGRHVRICNDLCAESFFGLVGHGPGKIRIGVVLVMAQ